MKQIPWISNEIQDFSYKWKGLKKKKLTGSIAALKEYKRIMKEIHTKAKICKDRWVQEQCTELEEASKKHKLNKVFQKIKTINGEVSSKILSVNDSNGELLQACNDIKNRWKEHFEQLDNVQNPSNENILKDLPCNNEAEEMVDFLEQEVREAIQSLKLHKALGEHYVRIVTGRWRKHSKSNTPIVQQNIQEGAVS